MEEIKKRQHYVWKDYLRSWAESNDLIPTYFKQQKKTAKPNLRNVAQEIFFYESAEFTKVELKQLLDITYQLSNENSLESCLSIFSAFTFYSEIKNQLIEKKIDFSESDIRFIKTNFIEDLHSDFEGYGRKLIKVKTFEDLAFLKDKEELLRTLIYLCIQYSRTKPMRNKFHKSSISNKLSNPVSMIFAISMANRLTFDKNLCFTFLINQTAVNYITGDQPVINLADISGNGSVEEIILYYPINPKTAIQINVIDDKSSFETEKIETSEVVNELNSKIYQHADNFVFSDSEEQILKYGEI
ncbi:DUF4238 domain-containing protein [Salegentibacter maritimus]|uniref:DUF4238 domain-containing protein n=1 Tax=Salegentibacter maritimus TaxID=2794347 RepID=A0ABS0TF42_9FLAO|nr:DUF4238 domain-containing protein [Salegentibacter maritimus]MBI6119633.1 DUF4238 domain-containing protein [Salegentibacter maritimus]